MIDKVTKNEELGTSQKTGGDIFDLEEKETSPTTTQTEENIDDEVENIEKGNNKLNPLETHKIKFYNAQEKKEKAKTVVLNILKYLIPIFVSLIIGLLAIFGGIWAYKLNNIAEPIGGIKAEIDHLKEDNKTIKSDIDKIEERINKFFEAQVNQ